MEIYVYACVWLCLWVWSAAAYQVACGVAVVLAFCTYVRSTTCINVSAAQDNSTGEVRENGGTLERFVKLKCAGIDVVILVCTLLCASNVTFVKCMALTPRRACSTIVSRRIPRGSWVANRSNTTLQRLSGGAATEARSLSRSVAPCHRFSVFLSDATFALDLLDIVAVCKAAGERDRKENG